MDVSDLADALDIAARSVRRSYVGPACVSTVKLPWSFEDGVNFETMIFGIPGDGEDQWQYGARDEAEAGHAKAVAVAVEWCREHGHPTDVQSFSGKDAADEIQRRRKLDDGR